MRTLLCASLGAIVALPAALAAQTPFDGVWKVDLNHVDFAKKPDVYLLQNGVFECKSCAPAIKVPADGADHAVTGHPYFNSVAVKVVSDHEMQETDKKNGKVVSTSTTTVSPDGKTLTYTFSDSSDSSGAPVTGKGEQVLVAKGPAGSNAVSGEWRTTKMESVSDNGLRFTLKSGPGTISLSTPTGQSYTARLDGTDAPEKGDPGVTSVSLAMPARNTLVETDKREGKVIGVITMVVSPDGKTMKASYDNKLQNRTTTYTAVKQ